MNFLLKRLSKLSTFNYKHSFFFSISNQQKIEMHSAILASKIIHLIRSKPIALKDQKEVNNIQNEIIHFPSLRSQLIQMIQKYPEVDPNMGSNNLEEKDNLYIQTAKKKMLQFFDGGVWVDQSFCIQQRFFSEEVNTKEINNVNSFEEISQKISSNDKKKLTFCPTYLVTGEIFRTILLRKNFLLITGHFGIGKTYSFMLYHLLSSIIYKYLHKYCRQSNQIPKGINLTFPKLVYWTLDINQVKNQKEQKKIQKIIANQCFELRQFDPNYNFFKVKEGQVSLRNFYLNKNINLRLVIDQIHVIASAARDRDNLAKLMRSLQKNPEYLQAKQLVKNDPRKKHIIDELETKNKQIIKHRFGIRYQKIFQRFDAANQLLCMVQELRNKFGRALFLSSRTIQKSQMSYLNLNGQQSHEQTSQKYIRYMQNSQTPSNLSDIAEFFVFLLKIKFKQSQQKDLSLKQQKIIVKIKQIIICRLRESSLMLLPLTIRYVIFGRKQNDLGCQQIIKNILNQNNSQQRIEKHVDEIINIINNRSIKQLKILINRFLEKNSIQQEVGKLKKIMLLKLLYAAKSKIQYRRFDQRQAKNTIVIDASDILNSDKKSWDQQIADILDKNFAYYLQDKKFYLMVNEQIVNQLLQEKEKSLLQALLESNERIYSLIQTQVAKGLYIQSLIRKCLVQTGTKLTLMIQYLKDTYKPLTYSRIQNKNRKFYFQSIPLKRSKIYDNFNFLTSFKNSIRFNDYGCFLYMPTKQKSNDLISNFTNAKQKKVDETSKKIDFVLADKTNDKISITAFDVTIDNQKAQKKIADFFYEFSNFEDKQTQQLSFMNQKMGITDSIDNDQSLSDQVLHKLSAFNVQLNYIVLVPRLPQHNIQWKSKINKAISQLNDQLQILKNKSNSFESKKQRLQKRIQFLNNLSKDENLIQCKSFLEIKRGSQFKSVLRSVSIVSFFDMKIENEDKRKISFYKNLIEHAKNQSQNQLKLLSSDQNQGKNN